MTHENLLGVPVVINPQLVIDLAALPGKMGFITYADTIKDEVNVFLPYYANRLYRYDELLILKPCEEVFKAVSKKTYTTPFADFKDIYKISLLLERGCDLDKWQATEIAQQNPNIWPDIFISVHDMVDPRRSRILAK